MKQGKLIGIISIVLTVILLTSTFLMGCTEKTHPGQVLKVGVMTPSTGPVPEKGVPGQHGFADAVKYINEELNGAAGYQIELVWRDSGYNMQTVGTITQEFMDKGCLLYATHSSTEMKAASAKANEFGFPGLAAFISTINLHPPTHVYGPTPDYGDDWYAFAKYYMENIWPTTGKTGKPKMALHVLANPTGQGAKDAAEAKAAELGIEVVKVAEHKISTIDETVSLTEMKNLNIDVLFISSTPAPTAVIIKNVKDLGMDKVVIGCAAASFGKALVDLGGTATEGVYGVAHTALWSDDVPGIAKVKEYCQANHPGDMNNDDYLSCWTTMMVMREILVQAVNNAGYEELSQGDAEAWKAVEEQGIQKLDIDKVKGAEGLLGGIVKYRGGGDNRLNSYLHLYQISGGNITSIGKWQEAPLIKYVKYGDS